MRVVSVSIMILITLSCASQSTHPRGPASHRVRLTEFPIHELPDCTMLDLADIGDLDVVVAIDASRSTVEPTGVDINENGVIGKPVFSRVGAGIFDVGSSDPGDTFLSAQVSGTLSLVKGLGNNDVRFAIVAFSSTPDQKIFPPRASGRAFAAVAESELTNQVEPLEAALKRVLEAGSFGNTDFTAGMQLARHSLTTTRDRHPSVRRLVLFMSDSPTPVLATNGKPQRYDPAMKDAALDAAEAGIVFHTFGLGAEAAEQPGFLEQIAEGTGGRFFPVPDLAELHCTLAESLMP